MSHLEDPSPQHPVMRLMALIIGWLMVFAGLIILPLPIPLGLIMIVVGLALLAPHAPPVRRGIRALRRKFPGVNQKLNALKPRLPRFARLMVELTDPGEL